MALQGGVLYVWLATLTAALVFFSYLHAKNIIHRDMKSNSILSRRFGSFLSVVCYVKSFVPKCCFTHLNKYSFIIFEIRYYQGSGRFIYLSIFFMEM